MNLRLFVFMGILILLGTTLLLSVSATRTLFAVEPNTSGIYTLLLPDAPADMEVKAMRASLPGNLAVDEQGRYFLYVAPQEIFNASLRIEPYLLRENTDKGELPLNPNTGLPFEILTEQQVAALGLRSAFGLILPDWENSGSEFPIVEGGAEAQGGDTSQEVQQQIEKQPQSTSFQERQKQKTSWALFLLPAALILILIFYIFWMRRKPVV